MVGQTLQTAMLVMEGRAHNGAHFGIGGVGGDLCAQNDEILVKRFGFSKQDLVLVSIAMQEFRKTIYVGFETENPNILTCTDAPFDYETGTVSTTLPPGVPGGMSCAIVEKKFESEASLDELISEFCGGGGSLCERIEEMSFEDKAALMRTLSSRYQFSGDLASSSAALDPIFWVLHGAVERLFQRILFEGVLTDEQYDYVSDCSGHSFNGTKAWLGGFFFQDRSVDAAQVTNREFAKILDPRSEQYPELVNFVYESRDWEWCEDFDSYFDRE